MEDIKNKKPLILNLSYERQLHLPLTRSLKLIILLVAVSFFLFSFVYAPVYNSPSLILAASDAQTETERKNLENQLAELEKQISDYEATIVQYQKQGKTLQSEIKSLESQIAKLSLQIKAVNLNLEKLNQEINTTQSKINSVEKNIAFNKDALSQVLQNLYENEDKSLMEIFLVNPNLSDFFGNLNNLMLIQDNLRLTLSKVAQLRIELLDQKEQLALEKSDAEALKNYRASQKQDIAKTQVQKNEILQITKGKESEYQKLVTETKKTAAEIRKQIFRLLGGGELNFEQAYELAKFAEQATGVRAALILAVLDRESALGQNVGRCIYNQIMKSGATAMNPKEIPVFLSILQSLNINPESIQVSCPNADGTYGGAMGPAQFIPSTWNLYKDKVAKITGNNSPSPWNNGDAFVTTAVYLQDLLNACSVYSGLAQERCAAARYYAGGRWRNYLWTYGSRVVSQAKSFQDDIEILKAS
jgi:membrane-bound lytic murein transglycosylase B